MRSFFSLHQSLVRSCLGDLQSMQFTEPTNRLVCNNINRLLQAMLSPSPPVARRAQGS